MPEGGIIVAYKEYSLIAKAIIKASENIAFAIFVGLITHGCMGG